MAIQHKFLKIPNDKRRFPDPNFFTENGILKNSFYKPEVMIIGTFNPNTPHANFADFFYGRNYFWTGFKQLRYPNHEFLAKRRMPPNGHPVLPLDPELSEVLDLCKNFKLTFSDLISQVLHIGEPVYNFLNNDNVIFNGQEYNLIQDNAGNGVLGLAQLHQAGQVEWNTQNIINYLLDNPQIKFIYLTRQPQGIWGQQWQTIANHEQLQNRTFMSIVTPSGLGIPNLDAPFNSRFRTILHYWVWNGLHHQIPVNNPAYGHFDHEWLERSGVDIHQF